MKAIVLADRNGIELSPLTDKTCVALLPVAAKPCIRHTIEILSLANIRQVFVVISHYAEAIEYNLGKGERWGIQIHYVLTRGQENPVNILAGLGEQLDESEYLLLRGDMLRSIGIRDFLQRAQKIENTSVFATIQGNSAGLCLLRKQSGDMPWQESDILAWESVLRSIEGREKALSVDGHCSFLDSIQSYHQANMDMIAGKYPKLICPGWHAKENLLLGYRSDIPKHNVGIIGANCRVHPTAQLMNVVLSNRVIVDQRVKLYDTVVLPGTYIGKSLEFHNAVVWENMLIQADTGLIVKNVKENLLADVTNSTLTSIFAKPVNQALGLLTLFISLPLWPLAFFAALVQNPRQLLQKITLRSNINHYDKMGNSQPIYFTALEWSTSIPILRHLPKLFAVVAGHLRMVGVSPQTPQQAKDYCNEWEKVRNKACSGLVGPNQLLLEADSPIEEQLMEEAYYANTRRIKKDIVWLLRGILYCFTRRAWVAGKHTS